MGVDVTVSVPIGDSSTALRLHDHLLGGVTGAGPAVRLGQVRT
jgi:hypothetical protein